jgi:hypothetical protein
MQGIMTFASIEEAVKFGFTVCDWTSNAVVVRKRTPGGWMNALVPHRR